MITTKDILATAEEKAHNYRNRVDRRVLFTHHSPEGDESERYERIRRAAGDFSETLSELCPPGSELDDARKCIQTAMFWANAAIARRRAYKQLEYDERILAEMER